MKTFEKDGKTNFVDDKNVFVGFDNGQSCCESFGWSLTRKLPTKLEESQNEIDPEGFNFDTGFFEETVPEGESLDCGGVATFRLTRGEEEIFLTLWNSHNGYYSHGFDMREGANVIREGSL